MCGLLRELISGLLSLVVHDWHWLQLWVLSCLQHTKATWSPNTMFNLFRWRFSLSGEAAAWEKMEMMHAGLLLLLFCSACSYQYSSGTGLGLQDPEAEWDRVAKIMGEETTAAAAVPMWRSATGPESLKANRFNFPPYMRVSMSKYSKQAFKPERGVRPLPGFAKEIVMVPSSTRTAAETPASKPLIEALCHLDRIYARIRRVFKSVNAYKSMSLGACAINAGTKEHYYFLYNLTTDCTYKKEVGFLCSLLIHFYFIVTNYN